MYFEHGAHHFTWVLDVLRAFVSVSELIWGYFIIKKGVKLRHEINKNLDFLTVSERINIKLVGTLKASYACISDRLNHIVAGNEKLFFLKYHILRWKMMVK